MSMHSRSLIPTLLLVATGVVSVTGPAVAQSDVIVGLRADMIADISSMESKYVALAEAMPASTYDWSPMEGVRSVGDVFCHVAGANYRIPQYFGVEIPTEAGALEQKCDTDDPDLLKAGAVEALRVSFVHARHAVSAVPDADAELLGLAGRHEAVRPGYHETGCHAPVRDAYARASWPVGRLCPLQRSGATVEHGQLTHRRYDRTACPDQRASLFRCLRNIAFPARGASSAHAA